MRRLLQVLLVCLCAPAWAQDPVHFADPKLKAVVEDALYVYDPTPMDMECLTTLTYFEQDEAITSLVGLEYATNLQELYFRFNQIDDLSPLAGLVNLRAIDLSRNEISDLSPLSGLSHLTYLNIHGNQIDDVSPLSNLTGLDTLILRFNDISDIAPLASLTNLRTLDLGCNQITDLSPLISLPQLLSLGLWDNEISDISALVDLTELRSLEIDMNHISDVTPLAGMVNLYDLDLADNAVADLSPLCSLTSLTYLNLKNNPLTYASCDVHIPQIVANNPTLFLFYDACVTEALSIDSTAGGSIIEPGEGTFHYDAGTLVSLEAQPDPGFVFVGWSDDVESAENPIVVTVDRDLHVHAVFQSLSDSLYVDDNSHADPGPGDLSLSDPNENGSAAHPFDSIQEAIDVAADATTIYVYPGLYRENLDLSGKGLYVFGVVPGSKTVLGPRATIAGAKAGPVVRFGNAEGSDCVLAGFTITQGQGDSAGAILCRQASPTLVHCLIAGNCASAVDGAAIACVDSNMVMVNCTVVDNWSGSQGAALKLDDSSVLAASCIFWGDEPRELLSIGASEPTFLCCNLQDTHSDIDSINVDPSFVQRGSWVSASDPNDVLTPSDPDSQWIAGDYHLMSSVGRWDQLFRQWVRDGRTSPCIDAGPDDRRAKWEPWPNGGRINLGAYGNTGEASKSPYTPSK